jgi:hypothetical protein
MIAVHCQAEICVMRKNYTAPAPPLPPLSGASTGGGVVGAGAGRRRSRGGPSVAAAAAALAAYAGITGRDITTGQRIAPYWTLPTPAACPLPAYGRALSTDAFTPAHGGELHCEAMRDFRRTRAGGKPLRVLLVGIGCARGEKGSAGASAQVRKALPRTQYTLLTVHTGERVHWH